MQPLGGAIRYRCTRVVKQGCANSGRRRPVVVQRVGMRRRAMVRWAMPGGDRAIDLIKIDFVDVVGRDRFRKRKKSIRVKSISELEDRA